MHFALSLERPRWDELGPNSSDGNNLCCDEWSGKVRLEAMEQEITFTVTDFISCFIVSVRFLDLNVSLRPQFQCFFIFHYYENSKTVAQGSSK